MVSTACKGGLAALLATAIAAVAPAAASAAPTVTLTADRTAVRAGTTVNFTLVVTASPTANHGGINQLADSVFGVIDGRGSCTTSTGPDFTPSVRSFTCTYPGVIAGRPGSTQSHIATASGVETFCGGPPVVPGGECPAAPPSSDVAFASPSAEVGILIKCKKGRKLRKGKCVKKH
jgi:hypothetical protein